MNDLAIRFWKKYHECYEIWCSWMNGGTSYYEMTAAAAKHCRDTAKEFQRAWLMENVDKDEEDFKEEYKKYLSS